MIRNRVHLVLAGLEQWAQAEVHAYVRFGRQPEVKLTRQSSRLSVFSLPDRVVYCATQSLRSKVVIDETFGEFDAIVPLLTPEVITEPIVLVNPYHAVKNYEHNYSVFGKKVIVDSGGFQMLRGTSEFVDPDNLIDFYNKFGDICMPLDLPLPANVEPYYFDAVTRMMRANDQYMEPKLADGKILALISQGSTTANRLRRLDGLKRKSDVVAIAGLNTLVDGDSSTKTMTALSNGLSVIDMLRKDTVYFHFLGVTGNFWMILYSIMVGSGYVKRCGGDSVSFRMSSINGSYNIGLGGNNARAENILRGQKTPIGTTCRCPVCRVLTDTRCLTDARLLEAHNLWNAVETKNLIADSVEVYLAGRCTLRDLANQWLAGRFGYELLSKAVDYLNEVMQKGYREWKPKKASSLFAAGSTKTPPGLDHYEKIIRKYEHYHRAKFLKK